MLAPNQESTGFEIVGDRLEQLERIFVQHVVVEPRLLGIGFKVVVDVVDCSYRLVVSIYLFVN